MKEKAVLVARILLGLLFFVSGLNKFLVFMPEPEMTEKGGAFIAALMDSGYVMSLVALTETVCGALLLSGFFVPLALVLLAPIIVNIIGFHLALDPAAAGLATVAVVVALHGFLTVQHWEVYTPLLVAKAGGGDGDEASAAD